MRGPNTVLKSIVRCAGENEVVGPQLVQVFESLHRGGVNEHPAVAGQADLAIDYVIDELCLLKARESSLLKLRKELQLEVLQVFTVSLREQLVDIIIFDHYFKFAIYDKFEFES